MNFKLSLPDQDLIARIEDAVRLCESKSIPRYLGFLDEHQQVVARQWLAHLHAERFCFWGGYPEAKRTFLCVLPDYMSCEDTDSDAPLSACCFRFRKNDLLTHRDFLGALMALNIKRDTIGDILVGDGIAVVFLQDSVFPLVYSEITKIGSVGVQISSELPDELPIKQSFQDIRGTVSSLRCDCIVALATRLSREKAATCITSGLVQVNHMECNNTSAQLQQGDILSIRGYGRFLLTEVGANTRKGRINLLVQKYL